MPVDLLPQISDIKEARSRIDKYVHATPMLQSLTLNNLLGNTNYLKAEIFQKTGSFKVRGALNKILLLSEEEKLAGVIAASAGNHAQAVAWAAKMAGVSATVIMPKNACQVKVKATRAYGADVILFGESMIEVFVELDRLCAEKKLTLIHPFDDLNIIAGAGTIALEILEQINNIDNVFVPVGGGGLIAGVAIAVKSLSPSTKVIGIEPRGANAIYQSLQKTA
jgi:threonine dehydratase